MTSSRIVEQLGPNYMITARMRPVLGQPGAGVRGDAWPVGAKQSTREFLAAGRYGLVTAD